MSESVGTYLEAIGAIPRLTHEELCGLMRARRHHERNARSDGSAATRRRHVAQSAAIRTTLIEANLRLVVSMARRYSSTGGLELLDLIQAGNLGLIRAVDGFDPDRGYQFSTYATNWIKQAIRRALDTRATTVHVPEEVSHGLRVALRQVDGEVERLKPPLRHVAMLMRPMSLEGSSEEAPPIAAVADRTDVEADALRGWSADRVRSAVDALPRAHRDVLYLHYGLADLRPRSCAEIAALTASTPGAVSIRLRRARSRLSQSLRMLGDDLADEAVARAVAG